MPSFYLRILWREARQNVFASRFSIQPIFDHCILSQSRRMPEPNQNHPGLFDFVNSAKRPGDSIKKVLKILSVSKNLKQHVSKGIVNSSCAIHISAMQENTHFKTSFEHELRKLLTESLARSRMKNSRYSIRAFAKKLGVSPAALSQILNGKRNLTGKTAENIMARLGLDPFEHQKLQLKIQQEKKSARGAAQTDYMQLQMDQYHMISEWYYFGILSLAETQDFDDDPKWIAHRLGIKIPEAKKALDTIDRLQLLKKDKNGRLKASGLSFKTSTDIPNAFLQKAHFDNLELAKTSLESDALDSRDFSSMTMAIDRQLIPEAKIMIRNFRRNLSALLESGEKKDVFKLNIQLFPITRNGANK